MRCPECGFESPAGMLFCGKCGTKFELTPNEIPTAEAQVVCAHCGAAMPPGSMFCGVCGTSIASLAVGTPVLQVSNRVVVMEDDASAKDDGVHPGKPAQAEASAIQERAPQREGHSPEGALREMVLVPGGWFAMGSEDGSGNDDERPKHQVELTPFYIDRCAVSNKAFESFMPSHRRLRPETSDRDEDPVVFVTHAECLEYCRWRAEQEGVSLDTYTLPSEAQWEFAARGGHPDRLYPWGSDIRRELCNTLECGRGRTVLVDEGAPNGFSLLSMGSNVREWCLDSYSPTFYVSGASRLKNPVAQPQLDLVYMYVVRGASFQEKADELGRCTARSYAHQSSSSDDTGFRCVRVIRPGEQW